MKPRRRSGALAVAACALVLGGILAQPGERRGCVRVLAPEIAAGRSGTGGGANALHPHPSEARREVAFPETAPDGLPAPGEGALVFDAQTLAPLEGVEVTHEAPDGQRRLAGTTDARGAIAGLPRESGTLELRRAGYLPRRARWAASRPEPARFALYEEGTLRLLVVDEREAAIPGLPVEFSFELQDLPAEERLESLVTRRFGETDASGRCERGGLPRGRRVDLWVDGTPHQVALQPSQALTEIVLRLEASSALVGRLVDEAGLPRAEVLVTLEPYFANKEHWVTGTAIDGRFRFDHLAPGRVRVSVEDAGSAPLEVRIPDEGELDLGDVVRPRPQLLAGIVEGLSPCLDPTTLEVQLWRDGRLLAETSLDGERRFRLSASAGPAEVRVAPRGAVADLATATVSVPDPAVRVFLGSGPPVLLVRVEGVDAEQPLAAALLETAKPERAGPPVSLASWNAIHLREGLLCLPAPDAAAVDLVIDAGAAGGAWLHRLAPRSTGQDPPSDVPSVRIRRGEIAFAAEAGAPVGPAEGTIELRSWRSRQSLALAEAEPALELCPGPYWCIARDVRGQATRAARVEVRSGERAIFDPGRQDGCSLSGRVSGSRVRPGIDEVRLSWLSGLGYQRRTIDGEGRFTFGGLAPGRYSASLAGLGTIRVDLEAGESAEVEVDVPELVSMAVEGPEGAIGELLGASLVPLGPQDEPVEVLLPCQVDPSRSRLLVPVPAGAALVLVQHVAESGPRTSYAVLDGGAHERVIRLGRGAVAIEAASEHGRAPELRLTGVGGWPWKGECPIAGARRGSSWWFDGIPTGGRTRVGPRIGALAPHVAFVTPGVLVE